MRHLTRSALFLVTFLLCAVSAHADIDAYISKLNASAKVDFGTFEADLGVRFGGKRSGIELALRSTKSPADAALVLWLGEKSGQPLEKVIDVYESNRSKGWGAMAKELGIKPGSPAFHALKNGNIDFNPGADGGKGNGKEKGKGKKY